MSLKPIQDQYTELPISQQRRHQLRNPEKGAERRKRYRQSEAGEAVMLSPSVRGRRSSSTGWFPANPRILWVTSTP